MVSATDPDAILTTKGGGTAVMAYYDNYLIDTASRVILGVQATPALFHQETVAARRTVERVKKLGVQPESLGADKAYGSGEFLAWLLAQGVQPHIPVIDRRHQTDGRFTRDRFRYEPAENAYYSPEGKALRYRGLQRTSQGYAYCATEAQCQGCLQKKLARPLPIASSSCTGTNRPGRRYAHWPEHQPMNVRGGLAIRSKPNSSSACASGGCDYAACGMSGSSSCWPQPRRT
jgi:Transposase DDE domain